jgi:hypothetical protein
MKIDSFTAVKISDLHVPTFLTVPSIITKDLRLIHMSNAFYPVVFTSENISKIPEFSDVTKKTAMVFHEWMGSEALSFMRNVTTAYLSRVSVATFVLYLHV